MSDRMRRARFVVYCLPLALVLGGAPPGGAAGPGGPPTGPPVTASAPPDSLADAIPDPAAPTTTPISRPLLLQRMASELAGARSAFRDELARLTARFERATGPAEALALQREIESLKANLELDVLEMQARFAREAGLTQGADELDALVAAIRSAERPDPEVSPAPSR